MNIPNNNDFFYTSNDDILFLDDYKNNHNSFMNPRERSIPTGQSIFVDVNFEINEKYRKSLNVSMVQLFNVVPTIDDYINVSESYDPQNRLSFTQYDNHDQYARQSFEDF